MLKRTISIRMNLSQAPGRDLRDANTGAAPTLYRGNAVAIRIGIFEGTTPVSMEGVTSLTLRVKKAIDDPTTLASKTEEPLALASEAAWNEGNGQNAVFELTDAETNFDLGGETRASYHLVITALLAGGETRTLGTGPLAMLEDNDSAADPPPENPGTAITLEEADLRYATVNDPRLGDAREPTAHAATHATGGGDPITPASIGAAHASHTHPWSDVKNKPEVFPADTHASSHATGGDDPLTPAEIGALTAASNLSDLGSPSAAVANLVTVVSQNSSKTLEAGDSGKVMLCPSAITLTLPADLGAGFNLLIIQTGTGQVTFAGATCYSHDNKLKTSGQYAAASILRVAPSTHILAGNLTA